MGMKVGFGSSNVKTITFKSRDGTVAGTMSVSRPGKKKTKRVKYNFKEISAEILRSRTSGNAMLVVSKAKNKVAMLRRQLKDDGYDSQELKSALAHAIKMEQAARKRTKHLRQEETIKLQEGKACPGANRMKEEPELDESNNEDKLLKTKEQELKKLVREYEKFMQEAIEKTAEAVPKEMSPEDFELLKKKHRAKEKQEIASGGIGSGSSASAEFVGMEMPEQAAAPLAAEAPVVAEGGTVDIMV